jgi:hypothetical protein
MLSSLPFWWKRTTAISDTARGLHPLCTPRPAEPKWQSEGYGSLGGCGLPAEFQFRCALHSRSSHRADCGTLECGARIAVCFGHSPPPPRRAAKPPKTLVIRRRPESPWRWGRALAAGEWKSTRPEPLYIGRRVSPRHARPRACYRSAHRRGRAYPARTSHAGLNTLRFRRKPSRR